MIYGTPLDPVATRWRRLLEETVRPHRDLPNLLSGGMDSVTLLLAQLATGGSPPCYTYVLGGSTHRDPVAAEAVARALDRPHHLVEIPRSEAHLVADIYTVMDLTGTRKKAAIQCAHAFLYLARAVHADGHTEAVVGTGAICLDDKRVAILWANEGEAAARVYRASKLQDRYLDCGTGHMHGIARTLGVTLQEPYSDPPVVDYALSLDYVELNTPRQKGIALRAYPDFFRQGWWRRNEPLQVGGGMRHYHDTLLRSRYNTRNARSVTAIYNDLWNARPTT